MDYSVEITIETDQPLAEPELAAVAAIGGAASGEPGERLLSTTLTIAADGMSDAAARALGRVTRLAPGRGVSVTVMTTAEADRRLGAGPRVNADPGSY